MSLLEAFESLLNQTQKKNNKTRCIFIRGIYLWSDGHCYFYNKKQVKYNCIESKEKVIGLFKTIESFNFSGFRFENEETKEIIILNS